jgi:hypothetical protein
VTTQAGKDSRNWRARVYELSCRSHVLLGYYHRKAIYSASPFPPILLGGGRLFCSAIASRRTQMQRGCMQRINRKRDFDVWQFRWSETSLDGKRLYRKKIIGTVEQYPDENADVAGFFFR